MRTAIYLRGSGWVREGGQGFSAPPQFALLKKFMLREIVRDFQTDLLRMYLHGLKSYSVKYYSSISSLFRVNFAHFYSKFD
jgi:hypothetical protein